MSRRVQAARREHPVAGEHLEVALFGILRQITDLAGAGDGSRVRLPLARQDAQRRGLAGAVAPDEPDPVPGLYPQGGPVGIEERARTCADLEVRSRDHGHSPCTDLWLVVGEHRRALLGARGNRFFEVAGEQADEELSKTFGLHVPFQASGVQSTP